MRLVLVTLLMLTFTFGCDRKSDAAAAQAAQGNTKAAANQLNAFINELNAQAGKHVTQQGYQLLYSAALYYINRLS